MKVVFFSTATSYVGGAIITLLDVMPYLQEKGIEPCFILKGHGSLEDILKNKSIPYYVVRSYDWAMPENKVKKLKEKIKWIVKAVYNILAELKIAYILKKESAEIYHLNCLYNGAGVVAAKFMKVPVVWHFREFLDIPTETAVFINSKSVWKIINLADRIICVSGYLKDAYIDKIIKPEKVHVIYDGINLEKFYSDREPGVLNNVITIGLSGTAPVKNHIDAILAMVVLKKKGVDNVVLKIAGQWMNDESSQKYKEDLVKIIQDNEIMSRIEFVGMQEDMTLFLLECDISLVCSKRESFGLAAIEAMACKVPIICSSTSISKELTNDDRNVIRYEIGNYMQLADLILLCIKKENEDFIQKKINNAEKYVRSNFSIGYSAKHLYKFYKEIVDGNIK